MTTSFPAGRLPREMRLKYVFQRSPFSVRKQGRVFVDLSLQRLIFYQVPFTHLDDFRHRRAIFRNKRQNVFAGFFFFNTDILSRKLTSERALSIRLSR